MRRLYLVLVFFLLETCSGEVSPVYFCTDTTDTIQPHVNIEQLKGMWYAIEIITHNIEEEHYVRVEPSCPVIYISDDHNYPQLPYNPLHRNYGYEYNYGERRYDPNQQGNYDRSQDRRIYQNVNYKNYRKDPRYRQQQNEQYGTTTDGSYNPYNTRRYGSTNGYIRPYPDVYHRLRIFWDQNGVSTEYHVRYNITKPGFWFSSGPQNGSELEPQYSHFAGTVQVIKAVGNHIVLTFCHQMPDRNLFTVLLSRENRLDLADISGVHTLLNRKGLRTTSIKKVCNFAVRLSHAKFYLLIAFLLFFMDIF